MFHLVQGDDDYRVALKRDELTASFLSRGEAAIEHYDGKDRDFTMTELFQAASTQSFFEPRKVVIVDEAADFIAREKKTIDSKSGQKMLEDLVKIGDDVLIIFTSNEKVVAKNTKVYKTIAELGKVTELKKFWHDPNEGITGELKRWIDGEIKRQGLKLTPAQITILVTRAGSDLRQLANELSKISLYLGDEPMSTLDDETLRALIPAGRELMIFHLVDAVAQKNRSRALAYLGDLLNAGAVETFIVTMLHRHLRQIYSLQLLEKDGFSIEEISKELELSDFKKRKLQSQQKNFPPKTLPGVIGALKTADREIKTSSLPVKIIMEKLIVKLAG